MNDENKPNETETKTSKPRGFAAMPREFVVECARKGGNRSPNRHKFTSEEAKVAGRKGGLATAAKKVKNPIGPDRVMGIDLDEAFNFDNGTTPKG